MVCHTISIRTYVILPILLGLLSSCASPWQDEYLRRSERNATQDIIAERFGPPHQSTILPNGDETWMYQYSEHTLTLAQEQTRTPPGRNDDCKQYILTFTKDKILWNWMRQDC
jgi:hypothetical protein